MIDTRKVGLFFLIAFGWSWLFWIPVALIVIGWEVTTGLEAFLSSPFNPAVWGPLIAAFFVTFLEDRKDGVKNLLRRGLDFCFGRAWYLVIFLLFPLIIGGAHLSAVLTGEPAPELTALENPITIPIAFVYILFLGGPLQEEFGWPCRGAVGSGAGRQQNQY